MKRHLKGLFFDYFVINLGLILSAVGIGIFLVPGRLVSSGVPGVATILFYGMGIPIGLTILIFNIPIFILGVKVFGKEYGFKTFFGIVGLAFYTQTFQSLLNNTSVIDYAKGGNLLLAPIFGGLFLGSGMGLIFRFGGSMGGADILGQVISKYSKLPVPHAILMLDMLVMGSGIVVFGIERGLYAILSAFTCNLILNKIFEGVSHSKMVYITSSKYDEIQELLANDIQTESTTIMTKSRIQDSERKMIMVILKNKQLRDLQVFMRRIDPTAFIVISEVYEVFGDAEDE
ncbi:MAG: YitT family protein [Psychrilyobacter sp.]|uniref:YitT family protein n=1 Tax=Psychrilyobacter sp. TaxID=2586924 RepID=UPI003C71840A